MDVRKGFLLPVDLPTCSTLKRSWPEDGHALNRGFNLCNAVIRYNYYIIYNMVAARSPWEYDAPVISVVTINVWQLQACRAGTAWRSMPRQRERCMHKGYFGFRCWVHSASPLADVLVHDCASTLDFFIVMAMLESTGVRCSSSWTLDVLSSAAQADSADFVIRSRPVAGACIYFAVVKGLHRVRPATHGSALPGSQGRRTYQKYHTSAAWSLAHGWGMTTSSIHQEPHARN